MNKLWNYLCYRKQFYIFTFLIIGIFYLILFLYNALIDAINYAAILSISFLFIYIVIDFYKFYKQSQQLQYILLLDNIYLSDLPLPRTSIEEYYHELLTKVDYLHKELKNKDDNDYHDMLDYFTLWVHQIKTPISALRLLIQSQEESQNDLLLQVFKIEQYVDMVLHYIKIDHMSSDMRIKEYSLEFIINDIIKKQATFFIQKKIKLNKEAIDRMILTDEKWISFVIEQILSNALKYTKEGSISIYEKDEILYIEDTGIGIKPEDLPRVFEKGFTGYNGRVDKKASGLGLYLCYKIICNLGYKIYIDSTIGKGTVVSIDFHVDQLQVE